MTELTSSVSSQARFAVLTPRGRGAVATIGIRGEGALDLLGRRFSPANGKELVTFGEGRAIYGQFRSSHVAPEDVVVGILGETELEIHCHGGEAAARAISDVLAELGAEEFSPKSWCAETTSDSIATAACIALMSAKTERAAAVLLDQYRGALRAEIKRIAKLLTEGQSEGAKDAIKQLLCLADFGRHLTQPWKVVFAGRPNVGKSSLMNAILGYERSIVWPEPGTTRDVLVATTAIDGWWVELSDVAGLRESDEQLEAAGIVKAEQQIATADLVVFVADSTTDWDAELHRILCERAKRSVVVHNKRDLVSEMAEERPEGVMTSTVTGVGLQELCGKIGKALVPEPPPNGAAVPFAEEQVRGLEAALGELLLGNLAGARDAIEFW